MSADVPRRLPPTQGERVRNIDRSHASLSARGRTASARPVPQQGPTATTYTPPTTATGGPVTTGTGSATATSITSTSPGSGISAAAGDNAVAIGQPATASGRWAVALGYGAQATGQDAVVIGRASNSAGISTVAIGHQAGVDAGAPASVAIGEFAAVNGTGFSVAIGQYAESAAGSRNAVALGANAVAYAGGSVAIGTDAAGNGAQAVNANDFALGTDQHHVIVPGALILADESGGLWRITVSGGTVSAVAYP